MSIKCQMIQVSTHHNFPKPIVSTSDYFFCPNKHLKPKDSSLMSKKIHKLLPLRSCRQYIVTLLPEKWLKRLVDCQKSWRLIFLGSANRWSARIHLVHISTWLSMCIKNMHSIWYYGIFKALLYHISLSVCPCLSPRVTQSQSHTPAILQTTAHL